jgi:PPM family protein phosphatase
MKSPSSQSEDFLVSVGVQCHVGRVRNENQDRITRSATPFGDLFVVADGMGGYKGGSEAAQAVVDGFGSFLNTHGQMSVQDALQLAAQNIALDLQRRAADNPELRGFGSTVVLCILKGNRATYAHAGDSRLYLVRDGRMIQVTQDHTVMQRLVAQGVLTPDQARDHPESSVLTRAVGPTTEVSLDIGQIELQPGDALLLCSDGLWAYARHEEMEAVVTSESLTPAAAASALLRLALEGGGEDNVSIQFLRLSARQAAKPAVVHRPLLQRLTPLMLSSAAVLAVGAVTLGVWNYWHPLSTSGGALPSTSAARPGPVQSMRKPGAPVPAPAPNAAASRNQSEDSAASDGASDGTADGAAPDAESGSATPLRPRTGITARIVIIAGDSPSEPSWFDSLRRRDALSPAPAPPSSECNQLRVNRWVLYHTSDSAEAAARLSSELQLPAESREIPKSLAKKCGGDILLASPRNGD